MTTSDPPPVSQSLKSQMLSDRSSMLGQYRLEGATVSAPGIEKMTLISSFSEVDEVLRSRDMAQARHPYTAPVMEGAVGWLDGQEQLERRRIEAALFRTEQLTEYESVMLAAFRAYLKELTALTSAGECLKVEVVTLVRFCMLPVAARLIGLDGVDTTDRIARLRTLSDLVVAGMGAMFAKGNVRQILDRAIEAKEAFVDEYFQAAWNRRKALVIKESRSGHGSVASQPPNSPDLLSIFLRHPLLAHDEATAENEALTYLTGGSITTSQAACKAITALESWFVDHPEDRRRTNDHDFLRGAAAEALRLYPNSLGLLRMAVRDLRLSSGRALKAGDRLYLDIQAANRDHLVFGEDADRFDPWRAKLERAKGFGMAFGGGRHVCVGMELTMGGSRRASDTDDWLGGTLPILLAELYRAGLELDPDEPPERDGNTSNHRFSRFPVRLVRNCA